MRTAPATTSSPANLRFGVVSCANLQAGWFSAYRHLADRNDLHAVLHLGDYLYEYGPGEYGYGQSERDIRPARALRRDGQPRRLPAQARAVQDAILTCSGLHARYAFIHTWDDHESANDAWKDGAGEPHRRHEGD